MTGLRFALRRDSLRGSDCPCRSWEAKCSCLRLVVRSLLKVNWAGRRIVWQFQRSVLKDAGDGVKQLRP
jgi:hypothetical protein